MGTDIFHAPLFPALELWSRPQIRLVPIRNKQVQKQSVYCDDFQVTCTPAPSFCISIVWSFVSKEILLKRIRWSEKKRDHKLGVFSLGWGCIHPTRDTGALTHDKYSLMFLITSKYLYSHLFCRHDAAIIAWDAVGGKQLKHHGEPEKQISVTTDTWKWRAHVSTIESFSTE